MSYLKELVAKAKQTTNSKEAERIKKRLIKIGATLAIFGYVGVFVCFAGFTISSMKLQGFTTISMIFFICFMPCGFIGAIGTYILNLGLGIVVAKATTNFLDTNKYCPSCGDIITSDEKFCSKCGRPLLINKKCPKCGKENAIDTIYCTECGYKLEERH